MVKIFCVTLLAAISISTCDGQAVQVEANDDGRDTAAEPTAIAGGDLAASPALLTSVENGLRYLAEEGDRWMEGQAWVQDGTGCVSCHHVGYALWSEREAARAGVRLDDAGFDDLRRRALAFQADQSQVVPATTMILADNHQPGDVEALRKKELSDGRWQAKGQFPYQRRGEAEGDGVATLWALFALSSIEPLDDDVKARRDRAFAWLDEASDGVSNEWTSARLVVESVSGDERGTERLFGELLAAQRDDGGWGWLADDPSNPFSTGQAIYALSVAAPERAAEPIRRGVDYLLARQQPDGTWLTSSKYTSETESEDRDYIYRFWGTAWATMGLSRASSPGHGEDQVGRQAAADERDGGGDRAY